MSAVRAGRRVLVLSASGFGELQSYADEMQAAGVSPDHLVSYTRFGQPLSRQGIFDETSLQSAAGWRAAPRSEVSPREFSLQVGESVFHVLVFADPSGPGEGLNTAAVCPGNKDLGDPSRCGRLLPAPATTDLDHWSRGFDVGRGSLVGRVYFRLFELVPDGSRMSFYHKQVGGLEDPGVAEAAFLQAAGAVQQSPQVVAFANGAFGAPRWDGGDGTAENRMLEIARLDAELSRRAIWEGLERYEPDVLWHYNAGSDAAGHAFIGVLDPRSPRFDAEIADALWPVYSELIGLQDWVLDQLLDHIEPSTIVTVISDHGMAGVGKGFSANAVLEEAGLLARHSDGTTDLRATLIRSSWGGGFFLNVNSTEWREGIVGPEKSDSVLDEATRALLAFVDPETGQQVVSHAFRAPELAGLGTRGPAAGDLYLDFAYGYRPGGGDGGIALREIPSRLGAGAHGFYPLREEMQTIWFVSGGGILPGQELPAVRLIDIAPTLATLIRIAGPRNARGLVVEQLETAVDQAALSNQ